MEVASSHGPHVEFRSHINHNFPFLNTQDNNLKAINSLYISLVAIITYTTP